MHSDWLKWRVTRAFGPAMTSCSVSVPVPSGMGYCIGKKRRECGNILYVGAIPSRRRDDLRPPGKVWGHTPFYEVGLVVARWSRRHRGPCRAPRMFINQKVAAMANVIST
jgi:hypothetical protein